MHVGVGWGRGCTWCGCLELDMRGRDVHIAGLLRFTGVVVEGDVGG
jgi:hypothetical protein